MAHIDRGNNFELAQVTHLHGPHDGLVWCLASDSSVPSARIRASWWQSSDASSSGTSRKFKPWKSCPQVRTPSQGRPYLPPNPLAIPSWALHSSSVPCGSRYAQLQKPHYVRNWPFHTLMGCVCCPHGVCVLSSVLTSEPNLRTSPSCCCGCHSICESTDEMRFSHGL